MNPDHVNAILAECEKRPVPPKPDQATFLRACDALGFQPPYKFIRRLSR